MSLDTADLLRVRKLPLLDAASADSFAQLMRDAVLRSVSRRTALTLEGEVSPWLPILMEGSVALESGRDGQGATLALLEPLSTVMLASVILDVPALVTAWAAPRSEVLLIPGAALRLAARTDPALAFAISEELSGCYSGVVRALKNQRLRGTQERLANYLLTQHRRQDGATRLTLPSRKRVLASLLGMTPENLSRGFASLAPLGVEVDGPIVTLRRPGDLALLAAADNSIDNHAPFDAAHPGQAERERRRCKAIDFPVPEDARP
jgi:CRP/FNR family transcriptional activator FtrB